MGMLCTMVGVTKITAIGKDAGVWGVWGPRCRKLTVLVPHVPHLLALAIVCIRAGSVADAVLVRKLARDQRPAELLDPSGAKRHLVHPTACSETTPSAEYDNILPKQEERELLNYNTSGRLCIETTVSDGRTGSAVDAAWEGGGEVGGGRPS